VKGEEASRTYAKAIYMAALEPWIKALKIARDRVAERYTAVCDFSDPNVTPEMERAEVRSFLPEGASADMENALLVLGRENALMMLGEITAEFEALVSGGKRITLAHVTSAVPLTDDEKTAVREKLHGEFGTDLEFEFVVDRAIIGGIIVRVGGRVLDNSLAGKLGALRNRLGVGQQ
jgi:F-type H+-transporting ATPase subunit delta